MRMLSLLFFAASLLFAARPLKVIFVDVEGGQATLFVSPSGESMLIDTGWSGHEARDAGRIVAAAKKAGVKRIDYLVVTHYHEDHVGGIPNLADRIPIRTYVDHGASFESGKRPDELMRAYVSYRDKAQHLEVKPGDTIPFKGVTVQVLSAAGTLIDKPMEGAGAPNPACAGAQRRREDQSENARSIGLLFTLGNFRLLDLADLTWNHELDLMCPNAKVPPVDLYVVSHHGLSQSNSTALVHALRPRVAIMNNGARKGGSPEAWQAVHTSPGLEDFWQLHYSIAGGKENNVADMFIANTDEICEGQPIVVSARPDGSFTVTNRRNKLSKTYPPRS